MLKIYLMAKKIYFGTNGPGFKSRGLPSKLEYPRGETGSVQVHRDKKKIKHKT